MKTAEQAALEIVNEIYKDMENQFIGAFPKFAGFTDEHIKQLNEAFSYKAYTYEYKLSKSKQSRRVMVKKSI
jgi:signal-transduction protein with cAMP-binding, CBS, and nucleotidyltransferase domain